MSNYRIVTDAAADLPLEFINDHAIGVISMECHIGDKSYIVEPTYAGLHPKDFYQQMREGAIASTSQINEFTYTEILTPILEAGEDAVLILLSSALTTSQNSARLAIEALKPRFPERRVACIDSLSASLGEGLLVYAAVKKRDEGLNFDELVKWVEENRQHFCHWFTVDDLTYLKRSGRLSATSAFLGTALRIKPVLRVDEEGRLTPVAKVQGRKNALRTLVEQMEATYEPDVMDTVFISHADCQEDAEYVKELVMERMGVKNFLFSYISPIIGAHVGPGTMTLFHYGKHR